MKLQHREYCAVQCYTSWLGRVLENKMCCHDHHVECPVRYLGWNLYFFRCIIVQNLATERGDPSSSSMCSLSTHTMVMCKASLTASEPCHCDLPPLDGTLGWLFMWDIPMCGEYKLVQIIVSHTQWNTRFCYLLKITVSTELHVSAHDRHHQAYKYCTIKMKNVQLLAGLYIEILCMSQS